MSLINFFKKRKKIYQSPKIITCEFVADSPILAGSVTGKAVHENTKVETVGQEVQTYDFSDFNWE